MKIAILADVHGNYLALDAVLRHAHKQGVKEIWYLGDFLGYGPNPEKVVKALRKDADVLIVGNYDLKVLDFPRLKEKWIKKKSPIKMFSFDWSYKNISKDTKKFLSLLPTKKRIKREGLVFLLVHGSPESIDDPLCIDTPRRRFVELAKIVKEDVVLCGHTHFYFDKDFGGVRFINPGSVGRPFDGDPRASYAVMDLQNENLNVRNFRIKYPRQENLLRMRKKGFPREIIQSIRQGRSL